MRALMVLFLSATVAHGETLADVYLQQAARMALEKEVCGKPFRYYEYMTTRDKLAAEISTDQEGAERKILAAAKQMIRDGSAKSVCES